MCDAAFSDREGKSAYGIVLYFDHLLVFAGVIFGCRCSFTNVAEMLAILYAERKAINWAILKIHLLLSSLEVIKTINKVEDWAIKSLVVDILNFSSYFRSSSVSFIPRKLNGAAHCLAKFSFG